MLYFFISFCNFQMKVFLNDTLKFDLVRKEVLSLNSIEVGKEKRVLKRFLEIVNFFPLQLGNQESRK
jgi:hypothetical protein